MQERPDHQKPFDVQWLRRAVYWEMYELFNEEGNGNGLQVTREHLVV